MLAQASTFAGVRVPCRAPVRRAAVRACAAQARNAPWSPGSDAPAHLTGALPADFGFDPMNLGAEPKQLEWYVQAELQHARWAMLGVVGVLVPDLLTQLGAMNVPLWTEVGALKFDVADTTTLFLVQMVLFSFAEHKRLYDIKNPGSQGAPGTFAGLEAALGGSGKVGYPGKIFDPLNLSKDPKEFATLQVKELKNGRLAMLAFAGFAGQTYSTGESPIANLTAHLADPWHTTVATNTVAIPHILGF